MLSDARAHRARALYLDLPVEERARWPVSPLSIAERALALVLAANPRGGCRARRRSLDRVARREGARRGGAPASASSGSTRTRICSASGSESATLRDLVVPRERAPRPRQAARAGARVRTRSGALGSTLGVRQFWAEEVRADPAAALDAIVAHVRASGVSEVYSNDIDRTDDEFADATGTPEPGGLLPGFVSALVARLGREVELAGGDADEVAIRGAQRRAVDRAPSRSPRVTSARRSTRRARDAAPRAIPPSDPANPTNPARSAPPHVAGPRTAGGRWTR